MASPSPPSSPLVRAAFVILTRATPERVVYLKSTLYFLFLRFNAKFRYPVRVLHEGDFDDRLQAEIRAGLRGDAGARYGASAIARYDSGRHSGGVTFSWTGATAASSTNPAGTFDFGAGYGYAMGKITPHANWVWERSTGIERQMSFFEGVEYQVTDPFAIDFSVQHLNVVGGGRDTQFVVGITVNTGHLHHPH